MSGPRLQRLKSKERPHDPGFINACKSLWQKPYIPDWIGFALVALQNFAITFFEPFHRFFSLDDRRIQFPYAEVERVSVPLLLTYAIAVPFTIIVLWTLLGTSKSADEKKHQLHVAILGLSLSLIFTTFVTDVIKNGVGRPRPDLLARCRPADGTPGHELVGIEVCLETDHHRLHDGFRSFPSGHSSFAWSGLGYLSLFFLGQLRALRPYAEYPRFVVAMLPAVAALLITVSRTEDYRHDVYDVCCGSLIGMAVTYFTYRRYFPALTSVNCDDPLPPRDDDELFDLGSLEGRGEFDELRRVATPDLELGMVRGEI